MKKSFRFSVPLLLAFALFTLSGCKKEEVVGPQGQQGPQGNANVHSVDFTMYYGSWSGSQNEGWEATYNWNVLTEEMVNKGGIFVYVETEANTFMLMPFSLPVTGGFVSVVSAFRTGELGLIYLPSSNVSITNPGVRRFRAVAISPKSMELGDDHVQELIAQELKK